MKNKFLIQDYISILCFNGSRFCAKRRFLLFSLLFVFVSLIFLTYPQTSLAWDANPSASTGDSVILSLTIEETIANASGTVTSTGDDATAGGAGFVWGTATGAYVATSSKFVGYATGTDFTWEISAGGTSCLGTCTLVPGELYYYRAYATNSVTVGYGNEKTLLTKPNEPTSLAETADTENSISLSWTEGTGSDKAVIRYNVDGTAYPSSVTDGSQAYFGAGTSATVSGLSCGHTYYFRAWSSTTETLSTTSDITSDVTHVLNCPIVFVPGKGYLAPTIFSDSLVINDEAATTPTREVELSLKADNANLMTVCNDNLFLNPLEDYSTTKTWTLTEGDGEKTVYVKFVSPDGLNSDVVSETIILESVVEEEVVEEEVPEEVVEEELVEEEVEEEVVEEEEVAEKPISEMTVEELQTKIAEILAQVAALKSQITELEGGEAAAVTGCTITSFDRALKVGMSGDDVNCLQIVLNTASDTQLADSGVGSPGNETSYFGPLTKGGVIKFQEKYADDVLASWGLTSGTGFVGSTTRAKLNELLK